MKEKKIGCVLLSISVLCFLLMSASFGLMALETLGALPGILFWSGLIAGSALQVILELRRRKFYKRYNVEIATMQRPRNGLLTFATDVPATCADVLLVLGFVVTVITMIATKGAGSICFALISVTVFAFCMHCILNGRIVFFLKKYRKIQQRLESKKESSEKKERKRL